MDGNGRVGRLFMNILLIAKGYTNIYIKGLDKKERQIYYKALQTADKGIEIVFNSEETTFENRCTLIEQGNFTLREKMIYESMVEAMNRCIIINSDEKYLKTLPEMAGNLKISLPAVKKQIDTGKLIASKLGTGRWKILDIPVSF